MFKALFSRKTSAVDPQFLYGRVVARARSEKFYAEFGVPDSLDGRFEMMVLHIYMVLRRLKQNGVGETDFSQALFDCFIDDMSVGLREAGVGDTVVPKRLQKMSRVFYGRVKAWDEALESRDGRDQLGMIMKRNLFPDITDVPELAGLVNYMMAETKRLESLSVEQIKTGQNIFPAIKPRSDI